MIRKWRNQKEILTPLTEGWEKTKKTLTYLYQENISYAEWAAIPQ